jgi:amino acid transporter
VSIFYLIAAYATVAGFRFSLGELIAANDLGPILFALSDPAAFGTNLIAKLIVVVVFLDIVAVGVGVGVTSTRGVFAMARDRRLPRMAASVSRYGTPVGAILLTLAVQGAWVIVNEASDTFLQLGPLPHYFSMFIWGATFGGFALLVVYLVMSLGAIKGLADHPNKIGLTIAVILGVAITGAGIFGSFYKVTSPILIAPWAAVAWGALGFVYMIAVKGREPASQVLPDLHAETSGREA